MFHVAPIKLCHHPAGHNEDLDPQFKIPKTEAECSFVYQVIYRNDKLGLLY